MPPWPASGVARGFKGQVPRILAGGGKEQRTGAGAGLDGAAHAAAPSATGPDFFGVFFFDLERDTMAQERCCGAATGCLSGEKNHLRGTAGQELKKTFAHLSSCTLLCNYNAAICFS